MTTQHLAVQLNAVSRARAELSAVIVTETWGPTGDMTIDASPYGNAPVHEVPEMGFLRGEEPDETVRAAANASLTSLYTDRSLFPLVRFLAGEALGRTEDELQETSSALSALTQDDLKMIAGCKDGLSGSWHKAFLGRTPELPTDCVFEVSMRAVDAALQRETLRTLDGRCADLTDGQVLSLVREASEYFEEDVGVRNLVTRLTTEDLLNIHAKDDSSCGRELLTRLAGMPTADLLALGRRNAFPVRCEFARRLPTMTVQELNSISWCAVLNLWAKHHLLHSNCSALTKRLKDLALSQVETLYVWSECRKVVAAARWVIMRHSIRRYLSCFAERHLSYPTMTQTVPNSTDSLEWRETT